MISAVLPSLVRCPDCDASFVADAAALVCTGCGRRVATSGTYLDLRPKADLGAATMYLDESFHVEGRHLTLAPPLLSAAIKNDMAREFLDLRPSDRVVDLGCGNGRMMMWNRDTGAHMVGVDVSPFFSIEAERTVDLVLGDLRRLPFASATYTKAYSLDVAEHLTHADLEAMLAEAARVLAPGGTFFVYSHVRKLSRLAALPRAINRVSAWLERVDLVDLRYERHRKSDHLNPLLDLDDLSRTVEAAGFRIARIRYYTPVVGALVENIGLRMAEHALAKRTRRRLQRQENPDGGAGEAEAIRQARARGKQLASGGTTAAVLRFLTWMMKLDIVLFGRIRTGPFFLLLEKISP